MLLILHDREKNNNVHVNEKMTIVIQRKEILFKVGAWIKKMELENNSCTFCKTISEMVFLGFSSMCISISGRLINFSFYKSSP